MDKKQQADRDFVRIELTKPQRDEVKHTTGKDAEAIELSVDELEERIAPSPVLHTDA